MKKFLITVIIAIIIIALVVTGVVLNSKNKNTENATVRVNEVTRSVFYAPQYVAIANGYFEEAGIEIELTTGQGADKVMTAVVSGQSDIGFAGPEVAIYVYNEGKEDYCQVFAQLTKKDGSFLVSRTNDTNFQWADLKGKTIIPGRKGGVPYMTLEYVLRKNGLDPETDVTLDDSIQFDLMAGAFTGGTADYVTLFEPTATMTEQAGKGYVVASVGEEAGEIPYTAYFAKKSYIEQNSDTIQKFTNAIYKGQEWVKEHTSLEIAEAIQSFFPDTEVELLADVIQNYIDIDAWNDTPILKEESFERLQMVMEEAGELKERAPYSEIVNNSYGENAIKK
jgi:NitT/TauT family transport system substrate-binding protein